MNSEKQTPLTLLDACTLLARETVSLLEGFDQIPDSAVSLRSALVLVNSEQDLGDGGALLDWVDAEMENTKHFAEAGEQTESLVKLKTPFAMPAPAMQMDAVCILLKAVAQQRPTLRQWQTMLDAVRLPCGDGRSGRDDSGCQGPLWRIHERSRSANPAEQHPGGSRGQTAGGPCQPL